MTFTIPVGPYHPALEEAEHFRVTVEGEEIVDVDLRLGYMHRGIERAFPRLTYNQGVFLSERICGICSGIHTIANVETAEKLAGIEAPMRAKFIRTIVAELERVHSHLLWAGIAAEEIGFKTLFMLTWRDRELVLDLLEMITGNRVNYAANTVGGVRFDITPSQATKASRALDKLEEAGKHYAEVFPSDPTILARCEGEGVLTKEDALDLCAVGPTARASGVDWDLRRDDPYAAYEEISFEVHTAKEGDVLANVKVRLLELLECVNMLRQAIEEMPKGPLRVRPPREFPEGEATGRVEAPRGELFYHFKSRGGVKPFRVKVKTPTISNIPPIIEKLKGETVAEIPIVVASVDPCFTCTERVTVVDSDTGESRVVNRSEMREMRK